MSQGEPEAIAALKRGDISGLEALVNLYQLRSIRTAYAITGDRQVAEDVAADAFLLLYDRIDQFDEYRPFAPWFYRIVVNGALKALRGANRSRFDNEDSSEWLTAIIDDAPGPEEETLTGETRRLLLGAIYALPPLQRAALVLRYYLDMDEANIARTLGCPQGTVKWRLHAGRERLRRSLISEFGVLAVE